MIATWKPWKKWTLRKRTQSPNTQTLQTNSSIRAARLSQMLVRSSTWQQSTAARSISRRRCRLRLTPLTPAPCFQPHLIWQLVQPPYYRPIKISDL
jgi:hypothetical protein